MTLWLVQGHSGGPSHNTGGRRVLAHTQRPGPESVQGPLSKHRWAMRISACAPVPGPAKKVFKMVSCLGWRQFERIMPIRSPLTADGHRATKRWREGWPAGQEKHNIGVCIAAAIDLVTVVGHRCEG